MASFSRAGGGLTTHRSAATEDTAMEYSDDGGDIDLEAEEVESEGIGSSGGAEAEAEASNGKRGSREDEIEEEETLRRREHEEQILRRKHNEELLSLLESEQEREAERVQVRIDGGK